MTDTVRARYDNRRPRDPDNPGVKWIDGRQAPA